MTYNFSNLVAYPEDFEPGEKVWFHGLKAKVANPDTWGIFDEGIVLNEWDLWAVPVVIKGASTITIAHVDDLIPRKKGEAWI